MPLVPFEIDAVRESLPPEVATFLADAQAHIDAWFAQPGHLAGIGFLPSDHELVWRTLAAFVRGQPDARSMLEWGSGFGVVAGLGAGLGLQACGIEIDSELVTASRALLARHRLGATIVQGSFVPEGSDAGERLADLETRTVLGAPAAYDDLGADLDDFDVVFAYPWPTEEELYCDLFLRGADYGAVLLTHSRTEGMRAYRKVAGRGGRRP